MNILTRLKYPVQLAGMAGLVLLISGCGPRPYEPALDGEPRTVIMWVSIDGVRPDYFERAHTPTFDRLIAEGAFSPALAPIFPSMTFPNHVSQSTGVTVDRHGVPLNSFFDRDRDRRFFYPGLPFLLEAEPIWNTATRQGLRVAVYDWVLSHRQEGANAAAYFGEKYDDNTTDRERIQQLLDTWRRDRHTQPLQLIMGYQVTPDKVGHEFGPDATEVDDSMQLMDRHVAKLVKDGLRLFRRRMQPNDVFYLILTSDHGMSEVHTVVQPHLLTGVTREEDREGDIILLSSANLAHVFLHRIEDDAEREARQAAIIESVQAHPFATIYTRDELPAEWGYAHPTRVGDLVVALDNGHSFGRRLETLTGTPQEAQAPVGMHGYDVATNPEMNGFALFWRYPEPIGGIDLGPTHSLQLHATVARMLGIEPAEGALNDPIRWD